MNHYYPKEGGCKKFLFQFCLGVVIASLMGVFVGFALRAGFVYLWSQSSHWTLSFLFLLIFPAADSLRSVFPTGGLIGTYLRQWSTRKRVLKGDLPEGLAEWHAVYSDREQPDPKEVRPAIRLALTLSPVAIASTRVLMVIWGAHLLRFDIAKNQALYWLIGAELAWLAIAYLHIKTSGWFAPSGRGKEFKMLWDWEKRQERARRPSPTWLFGPEVARQFKVIAGRTPREDIAILLEGRESSRKATPPSSPSNQ